MEKNKYRLPPTVFKIFQEFGKYRRLKPLEILIPVGKHCDRIFYVQRGGLLKRFHQDESNQLRTISFHLPNHRPIITIAESYYYEVPSNYEIKAFEATEVFELKKGLIDQKINEDTALRDFYYSRVLDILIYENELRAKLISYRSTELYAYLFKAHPEIIAQVPSKYIAEFMRISPAWLSKLRRKQSS